MIQNIAASVMGADDSALPERISIDAFHRGGFHLVQPEDRGHRAGLDAMLLAAAMPQGFHGKICDLGAGAGAAGLAAINRNPQAEVVLVEQMSEMAACARATLALVQNAHLSARASVLQADVELTGRARLAAGLADNHFGYVIMNPPFNAETDRSTPDELRRTAHVMREGLFERWIRTAAAIGAAGSGIAIIARPQSLADILAALQGRYGQVEIRPIHPRDGEAAIRIILRARKGSRAPLQLFPQLTLHAADSRNFSNEADLLINGTGGLFPAR